MLTGRVAIVTGGSSGIGEAIVRRFVKEEAAVVIIDRDLAGAERVAKALADADVMCVRCDVSVETEVAAAVERVVQRHARIDILVNNAGIRPTVAPLDELAESDWDQMLDVHAKGCFLCSKHVMRQMKTQRHGSIVNISSLGGIRGRPLRHSYIAAKHAIVGLTKSIALEGIADNIRATGGSEISFEIRPEAIAWAVLFLACDESVNITGVVLPVDGGIMAGSLERGTLQFPGR